LKRDSSIVALTLGCLLGAGCQPHPGTAGAAISSPAAVRRQEPVAIPPPAEPPPPAPAMLDVVEPEKPTPADLRKRATRFSLSMRDADLRESLIALARDRDTNLVIEGDVTGRVTVELKNTTLEETLASLLRPTFDFAYDGRNIRVFKPGRVTETFKVDYIGGTRSGSSQVTATASGSSGGSGSGFASTSNVQSDFKADFWEQLEVSVKGLLGKEGTASVHRLAGLITVTDLPDRVAAVKVFLDRLSGEVHGQVLIEAELAEVSLDDSLESGVDWSAVATLLGGTLGAMHTSLTNPTAGLTLRAQRGNSSAVLKALAQQGKVDVLSRPRVLTLNNQKALMKVGREDVFFSTTLVPSFSSGAGGLSVPLSVSTPRTITVGIMLDVSPQIRANGRVALHVHISITDKFGTATSPDKTSTAPILDVREADAVVEVDSGQTLAIGGLTQVKHSIAQAGVPYLANLPLVGTLFRYKLAEDKKVELVLLMTPTVVGSRPAGGGR
jgi:MSHA biogenesis protein MshL